MPQSWLEYSLNNLRRLTSGRLTFGQLTTNIFIFPNPIPRVVLFSYILQENEQDRRQAQADDIVPFNKEFFIPSKHRYGGQSIVSRCWSTVSISPRKKEYSSTREAAQAPER